MSVVTEYIQKLIPAERAYFERMRQVVHRVVPGAEETFSYGIPTYKHKGKYLIAFASHKKFLSIYPGAETISILTEELAPFKLSKGTISFTPEVAPSDTLMEKIVQLSKDTIDQ